MAGHHPVLSAGIHGNTPYLLSNLRPLMEEYDVTAYISGHDHNLQVSYSFKGCLKFDIFSRLEAVSHNAQNE